MNIWIYEYMQNEYEDVEMSICWKPSLKVHYFLAAYIQNLFLLFQKTIENSSPMYE